MNLTETLQMVARLDASQAIGQFQRLGREADANLRSAEQRLDRVGATMMKVGAGMVAGSVMVGRSLFKMSKDASDLNEAVNATGLFFGEAKDEMVAFGREAYKLGFSTTQALSTMNQYGNLLANMGLAPDQVAESSKELLKLAADFGSALNVDPALAGEKISAALRGEYEPARSLGIILSEEAVRAKALEMGLADTSAEIGNLEKAKARLAIITEQGAAVEDDFLNTIDNQANSARSLQAMWANVRADLGQAASPVAAGVLGQMRGMLDLWIQLPAPVKTAASQVATFGTIAVGAMGALSLGIGTVIRFRDQMTALAAASTKASLAIKGLGVVGAAMVGWEMGQQIGGQIRGAGYQFNPSANPLNSRFWQPFENVGVELDSLAQFAGQSGRLTGAQQMQARAAFASSNMADPASMREVFAQQLQQIGMLGPVNEMSGGYDALWSAMEDFLDPQSNFYGDTRRLDLPLALARSRGEIDQFDVAKIHELAGGMYDVKAATAEVDEAMGRTGDTARDAVDGLSNTAAVDFWQGVAGALRDTDAAMDGLLEGWDRWVSDLLGLDFDAFDEQLADFRTKMAEAGGDLFGDSDAAREARSSLGTLLQGLDDEISEATNLAEALEWVDLYKGVVAELEGEWGQNNAQVKEMKDRIDSLETTITTRWNLIGTLDTGGIMAALASVAPGFVNGLAAAANNTSLAPPAGLSKSGGDPWGGDAGWIFAGASGAVVTRPTLTWLGEAGPEMAQPLHTAPGASPLPQSMGGAPVYLVADGRVIAEMVADASQAMGGIPLVVRGAP